MANPTLVECYTCSTNYSYLHYDHCPYCEHVRSMYGALEAMRGFTIEKSVAPEPECDIVCRESVSEVMANIRNVVNLNTISEIIK